MAEHIPVGNIAVEVDIWVPDLCEALNLHPADENCVRLRCTHDRRFVWPIHWLPIVVSPFEFERESATTPHATVWSKVHDEVRVSDARRLSQ